MTSPHPTNHTDRTLADQLGVTLGEFMTLTAERLPDHVCFRYPDGSAHTFAEINSRVNQLVAALRAEGVRPGDRLAVFALDSHRYVEVVYAALKLGAIYVPLNYRLTRQEVDVLLDRAEPVAMYYDARYADMLAGVAERHPSIRLHLRFDELPGEQQSEFDAFIAPHKDAEPPVVATDRSTIAWAFTSGTTGLPKGVIQSQRMLKNIAVQSAIEYRTQPDDIRYTAAPTFHVSGICGLLSGVTHGYSALLIPQFEAKTVHRFMADDQLTAVFLVPTMISSILQLEDVDDYSYDRLRLMIYGASSVLPSLLRRAIDTFGCDFVQAFGAGTEAGLQSLLTPDDHRRALSGHPELLKSAGKPSFGVALRIVDDEMNDMPAGEVGEIATRSELVMDGYLGMPEETARAFRDGWFRAGDLGYLDAEGYLYVNGRNKDMIIRGGENIYPIEIETALAEHPDVQQSAVVGAPDEHWGEVVRAFVTFRTGHETTAEELTAHCSARLARFKVPVEFIFLPEMPTNASGKILKRELRKWPDITVPAGTSPTGEPAS